MTHLSLAPKPEEIEEPQVEEPQADLPQDLLAEDMDKVRVGDKFSGSFGLAPATLMCIERLTSPTLFLRFTVVVYGCEVAEVSAENLQDGSWVYEEM